MSPIIARAAVRNMAATGRRQFSVVQSLRTFARSFEPHVFQRLSNTAKPQAPDYGRLVKRSSTTLALYFPLAFAILGWPVAAQLSVDGRMH